ncbi:MAG: hypothetical protein UC390_03050 [Peptococcaceae bacterium]|nr:hypothetical protein [Peptococcaceae bacterium]
MPPRNPYILKSLAPVDTLTANVSTPWFALHHRCHRRYFLFFISLHLFSPLYNDSLIFLNNEKRSLVAP